MSSRSSKVGAREAAIVSLIAIVSVAGCASRGFVRKEVGAVRSETQRAQSTADEAQSMARSSDQRARQAGQEAAVAKDLALGNVRREEVRKVTVQFGFDSAALTDEARGALDGVVSDVSANANFMAIISGFTCDIGPEDYNRALAGRRAEAVTHYLAERLGTDFVRLAALGFGEVNPVAENTSNDNRKLNRRVEVSIVRPVPAGDLRYETPPERETPPPTL